MIELVKTEIEFKFGEQVFKMRSPRYKEAQAYREQVKLVQDNEAESSKALMDYLISLGMPADVCENIEASHLEIILDALVNKKK